MDIGAEKDYIFTFLLLYVLKDASLSSRMNKFYRFHIWLS